MNILTTRYVLVGGGTSMVRPRVMLSPAPARWPALPVIARLS